MFGTKTKENEKLLYNSVSTIFRRNKEAWEERLSKHFPVTLHIDRKIPYSLIKETREICGISSDYIKTATHTGKERTSNVDGGVIYAKVHKFTIPLGWFEVKSSNSCTAKAKSRGQATGLIAEQASRCASWVRGINNKVKPLIAFLLGTDFDEELGSYNIDRIQGDLHTSGNCNPYDEGDINNVSWFFYKKEFSEEELESCIHSALTTNLEKVEEVINSLTSVLATRA